MSSTIYDIAKQANVSPRTVARILTGETKRSKNAAKVKRIARECGYVRNTSAAALRSGKSNTVGVLIASLRNPSYSVFLESLCGEAKQRNLHITTGVTFGDPEVLRESFDRFIENRVDGVIACVEEQHPLREWEDVIENMIRLNIPLVLTGTQSKWKEVIGFPGDESKSMRLVVNHLIERGHCNIGYIGGPLEVPGHKSRYVEFAKALDAAKVKKRPSWILTGEATVHSGEKMALQMLRRKNRPDALVCSNDILAFGALRAAHIENLEIPDQIAITGVDDIPFSEFTYPELTTVRQPRLMEARMVLDALLPDTRIDRQPDEMPTPLQLIVRKST